MNARGKICLSFFPPRRIGFSEVIFLERLKNALLLLLLALFAAALILFPAEAADAARQGLALCLQTVLPSLFPFFVLSSLLIACGGADALSRALEPMMRPLFGLSGAGAGALALGLVGGYPVGARTAAELYRSGRLSRAEAEHLLGFCNNAGPGFILGVCGGAVFGSTRTGLYLYLVHVAAAVLTGVVLRPFAPRRCAGTAARERRERAGLAAAFPKAVRDSFASVWSVCGFVVIFAVVLRFLALAFPAPPALLGFVELTNGVLALSPGRSGFALCAALLGWGGLSVHAQTLSVLEGTGLRTVRYFLGKLLHALLSALAAFFVLTFL